MSNMKKVLIGIVVTITLIGGIALTRFYPKDGVEATQTIQTPEVQEISADRIHELVNAERGKAGLKPLVRDARLDKGAQRKSDEILSTGVFAHENPDGSPGLDYSVEFAPECRKPKTFENLSKGAISDNEVVTGTGWMSSKAHREAMLSPDITIVGYGVTDRIVAQHMC